MTKMFSYTLMILLSGLGAAFSSFSGGEISMWRSFILGAFLACAIAIGDHLVTRKINLGKFILGILLGAAAGVLIIAFKLEQFNGEFTLMPNPEFMIIFLCGVYGGAFQWIVISHVDKKFTKLFFVSFICISIKLHSMNSFYYYKNPTSWTIIAAFSAFIFTLLWYFPVWLFYLKQQKLVSYAKTIFSELQMLNMNFAKRCANKQENIRK